MPNLASVIRNTGIAAFAAFLAFSCTAQAKVHWGNWKKDGCTKPGYRQYSSVLWGIPWGVSWELTCAKTPVNSSTGLKGLPRNGIPPAPSRCRNAGGHMWGEVDVLDSSCALKKTAPRLKWGDFKKDDCVGNHVRQYSAQLLNIPAGMSWEDACKAAQGIPYGATAGSSSLKDRLDQTTSASLADRCEKGSALGITTGVWGEYDVEDTSCKLDLGKLSWGTWKQGPCITVPLSFDSNGMPSGARQLREYSSVLWNIPYGQSWEAACSKMPVTIRYGDRGKITRSKPDMCVKSTANDVIKFASTIALTAASHIKGVGEKGAVALDAAGLLLDLTSDSMPPVGVNIWGVVYVANDPTCTAE